MKIRAVTAKQILDSRREKTIKITVNGFFGASTCAPSGKSKGRFEKKPYKKNIAEDIKFLNSFDLEEFPAVNSFEDLEKVEIIIKDKIGANSLFALEASILKLLAKKNRKSLWKFLSDGKNAKIPKIISNTIGGGVHSSRKIKPDFQEFLVCYGGLPSKTYKVHKKAWKHMKALLKCKGARIKINDENAISVSLDNENVLNCLKRTKLKIGVDVAASQFYENGKYRYKNKINILNKKEQIDYIEKIAEKYGLFYVEDPMQENDFSGFTEICEKIGQRCFVVGDDLTVTNLNRVKKAVEEKSVNAVIIKPNQTGSLIEVKKVIDFCKENKIATIMSHRSGETKDSTISDLAVAWGCDFIKTPVVGKERFAKVKRLIQIERELKK